MTLTHPHVIIKDGTSDALTTEEFDVAVAACLIWQASDGYWHLYEDVEWTDIDRSRSITAGHIAAIKARHAERISRNG